MLALRRSLPRSMALARPAAAVAQAAVRSVSGPARCFERAAKPAVAPFAKFAGQQVNALKSVRPKPAGQLGPESATGRQRGQSVDWHMFLLLRVFVSTCRGQQGIGKRCSR